jgi:hypothetical protein
LEAATDLDADFQSNALQAARKLQLPFTRATFALETEALENEYFDRFEAVCDEIRSAQPGR